MSVVYQLSSGLACVTGLSWESASASDFARMKKGIKSDDIQACFFEAGSSEDGQMVVFGTINASDIPFDAKQAKGDSVSLAGLLALSNPSGRIIAVQSVVSDEDTLLYWFCAINDGQVVAESDVVGSWEEVSAQVERYLTIMNDNADILIGDSVSKLDSSVAPRDIEDFIKEDEVAAASIKGFVTKTNPIVIIAAAIFFVGAIGTSAYTFVSDSEEQPQQAQISKVQREAAQLAQAEQAFEKAISSIYDTSDLASSLTAVFDQYVVSLPVQALGWQLTEVECTQLRCDALYSNTDLSPIKVLRDQIGRKCVLDIGRQGQEANCANVLELTSIKESMANPTFTFMQDWQMEVFTESLMEVGRTLPNGAFTIQETEKLSFPGSDLIESSTIPKAGSFGVKSDLSRIVELRKILQKSLALGYTAMSISFSDGTIEVSGNYYEKGATQ
jgi:hypothetical protein